MTGSSLRAEGLASVVADALAESAIRVGPLATWLAPTLEWDGPAFSVVDRTGDATLYDGSAGIGLACTLAGKGFGRDDLVELGMAGASHAVAGADRVGGAGLYDGVAGIGLAALAVGHHTGSEELARSGRELLLRAARATPPVDDLVSGTAGIVLAMVRAATLTGDERWLAEAQPAAEQLVARAERWPWGWAWPVVEGGPPLCGLAHGAAGPAWALAELGAACGVPARFADAVAGARQYERSWFDPQTNGWPDLRDWSRGDGAPPRPSAWCHGSVGIGLSRLAMYAHQREAALAAEAAAALQSSYAATVDELRNGTLARGLTLCHGAGGTVELLVEAALVLGDPVHLDDARQVTAGALALLGEDAGSWPGGVQGRPGPGLMNGLAGTLLVLARLDDPSLPGPALLRLDRAS